MTKGICAVIASWAGAVVLGAAASAGAAETGASEPWRIILGQQLKAEKTCELREFLAVREFPLGEGVALEGRISCIDGREFTFSRQRSHLKFKLEICQPWYC